MKIQVGNHVKSIEITARAVDSLRCGVDKEDIVVVRLLNFQGAVTSALVKPLSKALPAGVNPRGPIGL